MWNMNWCQITKASGYARQSFFCEQSELRGSGGRAGKSVTVSVAVEPVFFEHIWGACTKWRLGDGGVSIPP